MNVVGGTSGSSPIVAGFISLVNAARKAAGKSTMGFINPFLYANYGSFVNDITSGNNKCTAAASVCCDQGFTAVSGWDPVTGLGSIDFTNFFNTAMAAASTNSPTKQPTRSPFATRPPTKMPTPRPSKAPSRMPSKNPTRMPTRRTSSSSFVNPNVAESRRTLVEGEVEVIRTSNLSESSMTFVWVTCFVAVSFLGGTVAFFLTSKKTQKEETEKLMVGSL